MPRRTGRRHKNVVSGGEIPTTFIISMVFPHGLPGFLSLFLQFILLS